jgi:hypothetical protein
VSEELLSTSVKYWSKREFVSPLFFKFMYLYYILWFYALPSYLVDGLVDRIRT